MWLAGWAARREPASGTASDLFAGAIVFEDEAGQRFAIITVDLIAVSPAIGKSVSQTVEERFGLSRDQLVFNASHTHTAPEIRPDKVPFFEIPDEYARKIEPYVAWLATQLVELVGKAMTDLSPVDLFASQGEAGFARNRRKGGGPTDWFVPVLIARSPDENIKAILFGYACHNLTLPAGFVQYCAEYAGFARARLEAAHPGCTAFFLTGAAADQDPHPTGTLEIARDHGADLAHAVEQAIGRDMVSIEPQLHIAFEYVDLAFDPVPPIETLTANLDSSDLPLRRKSRFLLDQIGNGVVFLRSYPCAVQVVRFGRELLLIALAGEIPVQFSLNLKALYSDPIVWVAAYCNEMVGYVPTRQIYSEGGYESGRAMLWSALPAPFAPDSEDRIMQTVARLMEKVQV